MYTRLDWFLSFHIMETIVGLVFAMGYYMVVWMPAGWGHFSWETLLLSLALCCISVQVRTRATDWRNGGFNTGESNMTLGVLRLQFSKHICIFLLLRSTPFSVVAAQALRGVPSFVIMLCRCASLTCACHPLASVLIRPRACGYHYGIRNF